MITETDKRTFTTSKYTEEFFQAIDKAFEVLIENKDDYVEYDWGMDRVKVKKVTEAFDKVICENGGFELDGRTLRHKNGIGNNNEWDIVDKDLIKVGSFNCNSDMFSGVFVYIMFNGEEIKSMKLKA